jgi:amino acid transporter
MVLRAYSLGAGTYTGIEAVSNGLSALREPRVQTGKRTMVYMAVSLAFVVGGLLLAYLLYHVTPETGKTLNAVLFERMTSAWPPLAAKIFVIAALASSAALLFIAAQTGFFGGPRVLANMAVDRWMPTRFATLSDRLVTQNGILLMGALALAVVLCTDALVSVLVVLYSINVFITFSLSQLGMVRHWWLDRAREPAWKRKLLVNGLGLHTLLAVVRMFPKVYQNFIFLQVGVLDAGNFKGAAEVENLREHSRREVERDAAYMRSRGFYAEAHYALGTDVVEAAAGLCDEVAARYPQAQYFAGQLVFKDENLLTRWLHNHTVFELQRRLYRDGRPMLILPIQV